MNRTIDIVFLALQAFNVAFLLLHDWIPLGPLSNLAAVRRQDSLSHRVYVTLLGFLPTVVCLFFSARYLGRSYPHWVDMCLWITYILLFFGALRAWWIPYLLFLDPERAARYQVIFAGTHTFLPRHNGIAPDTLHTIFHLSLVATILSLFLR